MVCRISFPILPQRWTSCYVVAGLIILLYDHVLSLPNEITLIWGAVPSFAKCVETLKVDLVFEFLSHILDGLTRYVFLFNRYLVPGTLMAVAYGEDIQILQSISSLSRLSQTYLGLRNVRFYGTCILGWGEHSFDLTIVFLILTHMASTVVVCAYMSCFENFLTGTHTSRCRRFLSTVSMFAVCSLGIANVLVLLRVVLLWDRQRVSDRPLIYRLFLNWFKIIDCHLAHSWRLFG